MTQANTQAQPGTHYTDSNTIRISMDCPCNDENCPFNGTEHDKRDMVCGECGSTLHPNPVQYELGGEWHVAHNLVCPMHAMTEGDLD